MNAFFRLIKVLFLFLVVACVASGAWLPEARANRPRVVDPVVIELHYQNGVKYYKRGLYDRAVAEFEKTLALDPGNEDAKVFLGKVRLVQKNQTIVEAKMSENAEIKQLYDEGRRLYKQGEYQKAIEVFDKVLTVKPIDDFASYYKERSEIFLSRQIARQRKAEANARLKEARKQAKIDRANEKQARAERRREEKEAKRRPVDKTDRSSVMEQDLAAYEVETVAKLAPEAEVEPVLDKKARLRQERLAAKEEKRRQKLELVEEKRAQKEERVAAKKALAQERRQAAIDRAGQKKIAKQERIAQKKEAARERREAKIIAREYKGVDKKDKVGARRQAAAARKKSARMEKALRKQDAKNLALQRRESKALFLKGVEQYGRKEYEEAIRTFESLIETEGRAGQVYSGSARRLMEKARMRLEGVGRDQAISK